MDIRCRFQVNGTIVDNEFIDRYMAAANGEYVKVYLYLLRHGQEPLNVSNIADALNHTEADVKRALAYWEKLGALKLDNSQTARETAAVQRERLAETEERWGSRQAADAMEGLMRTQISDSAEAPAARQTASDRYDRADRYDKADRSDRAGRSDRSDSSDRNQPGGQKVQAETAASAAARKPYSQEQVNRLSEDEDFTQLLYIAQKYMNKVFTPRECEVFAYLYDGLRLSAELLEYLVEYCVQGGHTSIRYIETVGLNWHEKGLLTVDAAKAYASGFTKDSFAVMRAFGLTDRKPGNTEKEMIERWFGTYGFGREVVLEACNRTLEAIHSPSFRYADKILSEWKKAGVKTLSDVSTLDKKRQGSKNTRTAKRPANQFHNFEQRNTDYDSMVLDQVKSWISEA